MKRVSTSETKLVKTNIKKELKKYQIRLDDARERVDANVQRGKCVDWVSKFEKTYTQIGNLGDMEKQEYLRGLVERIDVNLDSNNDHILDIRFTFPIVNDKHQWLDKTPKPRTYKVTKGKYNKVIIGVFSSTALS